MRFDLEAIRRCAEAAARPHGCTVWDVRKLRQHGDEVLRVDIDKEEGVTLADCEQVSRDLDAMLDVEDFIDSRYLLQVSSAGIERSLRQEVHWAASIGQRINVVMKRPKEGRSTFHGEVVGLADGRVTLHSDAGEVALPIVDVKRANWVYEPRTDG